MSAPIVSGGQSYSEVLGGKVLYVGNFPWQPDAGTFAQKITNAIDIVPLNTFLEEGTLFSFDSFELLGVPAHSDLDTWLTNSESDRSVLNWIQDPNNNPWALFSNASWPPNAWPPAGAGITDVQPPSSLTWKKDPLANPLYNPDIIVTVTISNAPAPNPPWGNYLLFVFGQKYTKITNAIPNPTYYAYANGMINLDSTQVVKIAWNSKINGYFLGVFAQRYYDLNANLTLKFSPIGPTVTFVTGLSEDARAPAGLPPDQSAVTPSALVTFPAANNGIPSV